MLGRRAIWAAIKRVDAMKGAEVLPGKFNSTLAANIRFGSSTALFPFFCHKQLRSFARRMRPFTGFQLPVPQAPFPSFGHNQRCAFHNITLDAPTRSGSSAALFPSFCHK